MLSHAWLPIRGAGGGPIGPLPLTFATVPGVQHHMASLQQLLSVIVADAFEAGGYDRQFGTVVVSNRPDLGQFQCNGALPAAGAAKTNPRQIATEVADRLSECDEITEANVAGPGFINIRLADSFIADHVNEIATANLGVASADKPATIVIDYGGANIAKPLHVGHLRSAIIGEALKRLARAIGHTVIGDVHLGDWGLQMGQVITEIGRRYPDLPYFDASFTGPYPDESPVSAEDLEEIYPAASARCKEDESELEKARQVTLELQQGRPGYHALWRHIHDVSVADLRGDYEKLNIEFDLWLGESDSQDRIPVLVESLKAEGFAQESQGALVVFVDEPDDRKELPPLILVKSDGAAMYGTTDMATIVQRMDDYSPDLILYLTDKRQSDHFVQVFRAARKTGIAPAESVQLEHLGFGMMNGKDGRPFKTRAGGVMKLKDLIQMLEDKALERMGEVNVARDYDDDEKQQIARMVGVAALKFGDLSNQPTTDYIFDLDRFASFEGKTGPYLLYAAVRIKSILRRAAEEKLEAGAIIAPESQAERDLLLKLAGLPDQLQTAFDMRAPHYLCDYAYELASLFSGFYRDHHILRESDAARQSSWLQLSRLTLETIERVTGILGIDVPERM